MSTFNRIGREYLAQLAAFVVALSDRLFIPAVFLRTLGVASFSAWSVAIAAGAFVSVLEFGVTRFYTNRLIALVERNDLIEARREYRVAQSMIALLAIFGVAIIAASFRLLVKGVGDPALDAQLPWVAVPITMAAAALQLLALRQALYRAHREFARETWIRLSGEAARIAAVVLGALSGLGLLEVSWLWFIATVGFVLVPIGIDTRRRYNEFQDMISIPSRMEIVKASRLAPGLWLQSMFMTLYATVPVMAIGALTAAPALIAQFVLMRTIANFVRQILQMFANLFGIELARRNAIDDTAGFAQVFEETNRFLAVQASVASAALLVLGQPLFTLWTNKGQLFDPTMLLFAVLPPLLFPSMMLSIEALAYANRPWPIVRARTLQLLITVVVFFLLFRLSPGLRMMSALLIGEALGLGLGLVFAIGRLNPLVAPIHSLKLAGYSAISSLATYAFVWSVWHSPLASDALRLIISLLASGLSYIALASLVGVNASRRNSIVALARGRLGRSWPV